MKALLPIAAFAALATPAHAEELHVRGDRLFVPVEIGGERVEALLDSGAEVTVLDRAFAARIDLGAGETVTARGTGAASVEATLIENLPVRALGRELVASIAAIVDLSDVGARLIGGPLPAVLGREVFDAGRLEIDIEGGTIDWLADEAMPDGTRLPLSAAHGIETIPVSFGTTEVQADFDLGNGTGLLVSQALVDRLGLTPVGVEPGGGLGGAKGRPVIIVPELTIAGQVFQDVRAHVDEVAQVDANVGVAQLRSFAIVTDFPGRAVWFARREN
ncbi:retropepsin-like aspartic protease [Erythrobacter mangrovi]|uniref:Retropepsin-like domain-containing protein n=1 Tax=Erythrobacter mangrovi TaxID=2739433 RepID=A0A7D3XJG1_9SPHN|nr:retropepsin-like aspartic protease [Erythrobacter mangrovi]QKG71979.1 retropepsin-like domain-containing protein [Erythrobacter mangrovi]